MTVTILTLRMCQKRPDIRDFKLNIFFIICENLVLGYDGDYFNTRMCQERPGIRLTITIK